MDKAEKVLYARSKELEGYRRRLLACGKQLDRYEAQLYRRIIKTGLYALCLGQCFHRSGAALAEVFRLACVGMVDW